MSIAVNDIPLTQIHEAPWNPRKHFSDVKLAELADSIRDHGVIEPAIVRARHAGGFELVAGARRFRASQLAERETLPCLVRELDDAAALEHAVIENGQREDVSPIEEAAGYAALQAMDPARFTVAEIAAKVGKHESYVYRRLKLGTLEEQYRTALDEGRLTIAHAEALCRLTPAQRKEAREKGLIWRGNMFDDSPEANARNLSPLNELLSYIRNRTHFDPAAADTRHFQPELAVEIDAIAEEVGQAPEQVAGSLIELSTDSLVRMKLGAREGQAVPLPPSQWREAKTRCPFTRRGVITHGDLAKVIDVCTAKTKCERHFPELKAKKQQAKKAKTHRGPSASAPKVDAVSAAQREAEQKRQRDEAVTYWNGLVARLRPAIIDYTKGRKLTAQVLLDAAEDLHRLHDLKREWNFTITDANLGQAVAIACVELETVTEKWERPDDHRAAFLRTAKLVGFNMGAVEQKYKAELKADAAALALNSRGGSKAPAKKTKAKK